MLTTTPDELFKKNIKLAYSIANSKKYYSASFTIEDIRQECLVGLWQAACTFKAELGYEFTTYAYRCICNNMLKYLRHSLMIKGPSHNIKDYLVDDSDGTAIDYCTSSNFENQVLAKLDCDLILGRMKPKRAEVIADYYGKELLLSEIAAEKKVTAAAIGLQIQVGLNAGKIAAMGWQEEEYKGRPKGKAKTPRKGFNAKTRRNLKIYKRMVAKGKTTKDIMNHLGCAESTVARYRKLAKEGVSA